MKSLLSVLACSVLALVLLSLGMSRELPLGSMHGAVTLEETGKPFADASVVLVPANSSDEYEVPSRLFHVKTDEAGKFSLRHIPAGKYEIEIAAKHHRQQIRRVEISASQDTVANLALKPSPASLSIYLSQPVAAPGTSQTAQLIGFEVGDSLRLQLRKVSYQHVEGSGGLSDALSNVVVDKALDQHVLAKISTPVWTQDVAITHRDIEGGFVNRLKLPPEPEGFYLVTASGKGAANASFINVTRLAMVTKSARGKTLCYVTDIDSGRPLQGVHVLQPGSAGMKPLQTQVTDGAGLATIPVQRQSKTRLIFAEWKGSIAIGDLFAADPPTSTGEGVRIFTYTERPVYRPGDTVNFKSVIRRLSGTELVLPGSGACHVKIMDARENVLQSFAIALSPHGTIHGSFALSPEINPGVYTIHISAFGAEDSFYVNFADYRKPDYRVTVTTNRPRVAAGEAASATIDCQYYFGGPVVGAKVTAMVYRTPSYISLQDADSDDEDFSNVDEGFHGGELVGTFEAVTDGLGKGIVQIPTSLEPDKTTPKTIDYQYSIQAAVQGAGNRSFEGSATMLVTQGAFELAMSFDEGFVDPGGTAMLTVRCADPSAENRPVANQKVDLEIYEARYLGRVDHQEAHQTASVTTDKLGIFHMPVVARTNYSLLIEGTTHDAAGRAIRAETELYVDGSPTEGSGKALTLAIRLDRKRYSIGDVAKVALSTNEPGGSALVTIESDSIQQRSLVNLESGSGVATFPVKVEMSPNVFVSAVYVRHRKFCEASRNLIVARKQKRLLIDVMPNHPKALPGSDVSFQIRTRTIDGKPTPANVSLGLVDESLYAIRKDTTDISRSLYPHKENLVITEYSFPEIYLDGGDKGGGPVAVRRKFLDTAGWVPEVQTNHVGIANVRIRLPDNLTSWRATVVGATDDTKVGMATAQVTASKPLMVRVLTPRFMVVGDLQSVSAALTNDSGTELTAQLQLQIQGAKLLSTGTQTIHLATGETREVPLSVEATQSGSAQILAETTAGGGLSDSVEAKFPVKPHGVMTETLWDEPIGTGATGGMVSHDFYVDPSADRQTGGLEVSVSPSVASSLVLGLDQVMRYPYGCVEQTLSRFVPAVDVVDALKGTPWVTPGLKSKANKIAIDGFARLEKMQHPDGGWGWWNYDASDPLMTAFVLDGLAVAARAHRPSPPALQLVQACRWAHKVTEEWHDEPIDVKLYLSFALAAHHQLTAAPKFLVKLDAWNCSPTQAALACLAASALGDRALVAKFTGRLESASLLDRPKKPDPLWSEDETMALVFRALTAASPNSNLIPRIVRELNRREHTDGWISTRATTMAEIALCDYLRIHPDNLSRMTLDVILNGKTLRRIEVDPVRADAESMRFTIPVTALRAGENTVAFHALAGQALLSTNLKQFIANPATSAISERSFTVARSYHLMEPTRLSDGTLQLLPSLQPLRRFHPGDVIRCQIRLASDRPINYLTIEDPLPSNCEVTDREDPMEGSDWNYWWCGLTILDDRVAVFVSRVPTGVNTVEYTIRAEGEGTVAALPTTAKALYLKDRSSVGAEDLIRVGR